jgi:hypothetical protein
LARMVKEDQNKEKNCMLKKSQNPRYA